MTAPAISRRVIVTGRGGPEVLDVIEVEVPEPRPGQVRVAVEVAGVAFGDVVRRRGPVAPRPPFTPGYDVVGVVDAVGDRVAPAWLGRRVGVLMPRPGRGGYADHVCVPAERLVRVPDGVDPAAAVALGLNYVTAHQLIHRVARVGTGQRVLIHGAAGGVGSALTDVGRHLGLTMYGTASAAKHDQVRERGAVPIDYRTQDFVARMAELEPGGVDAVFDPIGGDHLRDSYRTLAPGGTLAWYGASADLDGGWRGLAAGLATLAGLAVRRGRRVRIYMITATPGAGWRACRDDWAALLDQHRAGELTPLVGARVPLAEVRTAHAMIDGARVAGKIVLLCGPDREADGLGS